MFLFRNKSQRNQNKTHSLEYKENAVLLQKVWMNVDRIRKSTRIGQYESMFRDNGLEYAGSRQYVYGDDSRYIDWNVTGRLQKLHTKSFFTERSRTLWCVCDISASMEIGSPRSLLSVATEIGATFLLLAHTYKDKTGAITFSEEVDDVLPIQAQSNVAIRFVTNCMGKNQYKQKSSLYSALLYTKNILSQRSFVVIISDFFTPRIKESISLISCYHDVLAIRVIYDVHNLLPYKGVIPFKDSEEREKKFLSFSKIHSEYMQWCKGRDRAWKDMCRNNKIQSIDITSGDSILYVLLRYIKYRKR